MRCSWLALALFAPAAPLAACVDRPHALVLCHNSNCSEPHDPARDDTLAAMADSFALTGDDGLPIIDGIELDLIRHQGRCVYAHDGEHVAGHPDIQRAATAVADYVTTSPRPSHGGEQFTVKLELKPEVDGRAEHPEQVECALEVYEILRVASFASGHRIELVFDSYDPALLREVHARRPADEDLIWTRLSLDIGVPPPLTEDNYSLDKVDVPIDIAEIHGSWITDTALRTLRSMDVEFSVWSFDLTRETLEDIERIQPRYALTGQARTLRAWLDR
jgi:hypothetical protein